MATLVSAFYGDETSTRQITDSLQKAIQGDGSLQTVVNSSLLPIILKPGEIKLSNKEVQDAKDQAINQCGSAADSTCVESTQQRLMQSKLSEKEREVNSSANLIKGKRLTVNYTDANGKPQTAVIPEGQTTDFKAGTFQSNLMPSLTGTLAGFAGMFATILYVGSVLLAIDVLRTTGWRTLTVYILTAVSVIFPMSGFAIAGIASVYDGYAKTSV